MNSDVFEAISSGKFSDAIKLLTKLIDDTTNRGTLALLYCNRAGCHERLELFKHVVKDCDKALENDPNLLRAYIRKVQALRKLKKKKEARRVQDGAAALLTGDYDMELLFEIQNLGSENLPAAEVVRAALPAKEETVASTLSTGEHPQATPKTQFERVSSHHKATGAAQIPSNLLQENNEQERLQLGILEVNAGRVEQGIKIFDALLRAASDDLVATQAFVGRGTAKAMAGNLKEARDDFSDALRRNPDAAEAWKRRGQTNAALGELNEALTDLSKSISLQPSTDALNERGMVYHKLRDYHRATQDLELVITQLKDNANTWNMLGLCYMSLGNCEKALPAYREAVRINPRFKEAWANMAQTHKELAQADKALEYFSKALAVDPKYIHAHRFYGMTLHGLGRHRDAARRLKLALENDPSFLEAHFMSAICLHALGHHHAAVAEYNIVLVRPPTPAQ
ncbi:hypothetical protein CYMTET_25540 [Cymbomonas tetramitiformis]|uniref:Uncharacterized protein n=1 Tax=Cymbomonas tetramitiformis TaxID=36881 RepID=A0AAE0KZ53_9CHLO|nr:hypothetical protein CYMTET_25540 [Cymbomonas tetramitiformis]